MLTLAGHHHRDGGRGWSKSNAPQVATIFINLARCLSGVDKDDGLDYESRSQNQCNSRLVDFFMARLYWLQLKIRASKC
jgi:hypothetical protein